MPVLLFLLLSFSNTHFHVLLINRLLNTKVENFIDSHIVSLQTGVTQVLLHSGRVNPATPPCRPNPLKSKIKPRFAHLTKMKPLRKLLFHDNLTKTEVSGEELGESKCIPETTLKRVMCGEMQCLIF